MTVLVSFVSSIPPLFAHSTPYFSHTHRATVALGAPSRGGGGGGVGPSRGPGGDPAHWVGHTPRARRSSRRMSSRRFLRRFLDTS